MLMGVFRQSRDAAAEAPKLADHQQVAGIALAAARPGAEGSVRGGARARVGTAMKPNERQGC
jgi:hypothetical protein